MPTHDDGRRSTVPTIDEARAKAAADFASLTEAPFEWDNDPEAIIAESRRVSDALRTVFGSCEKGVTDLHILVRATSAAGDAPRVSCAKCGEEWF